MGNEIRAGNLPAPMLSAIDHIGIAVDDLEAAIARYRDELGMPLFTVGPTAWALVIEDRGDTFVVRHEDGRVGYLHDTSGVTRG